ncbi:MAG: hypothetical protein KatS3mg110_3451 [Pirellulaceae bacterium]|nr:MAG: hypothetical protein KatS3mg110_3451 [Pirellulaceae bacterium]
MKNKCHFRGPHTFVLWSVIWAGATSLVSAQGFIVTGVGAVNRGFGGAGTAAPLEAITALHWNPGAIVELPGSQFTFGTEVVLPSVELGADVGGMASRTAGEPGAALLPAVGWVYQDPESPAAVGLGMYGVAGFRSNLPQDPTNPILALGPLYADAEVFQIAPTVAYRLTDRLSFGVAPTITVARIALDPLGPSFITPLPTPGTSSRVHWGGGVQAGLFWRATDCWHWGFTIKSPQWMEDFRFFTPNGVVTADIDYPMILSLGTAWDSGYGWLLALDARYFDYKNTSGFRELGWSNVFAGAVGLQRTINSALTLRCGYNFNQNPIRSSEAFANLLTPLIQEHNISAGCSLRIAPQVELALAYVYLVNNGLTGPLPSPPFGPTDTLTHEINAHSVAFAIVTAY